MSPSTGGLCPRNQGLLVAIWRRNACFTVPYEAALPDLMREKTPRTDQPLSVTTARRILLAVAVGAGPVSLSKGIRVLAHMRPQPKDPSATLGRCKRGSLSRAGHSKAQARLNIVML